MEYTEAVHASMLLRILSMPNTCGLCPLTEFEGLFGWNEDCGCFRGKSNKYSRICRPFVGLSPYDYCPCNVLGKKESIKRTWIALEEKGYI